MRPNNTEVLFSDGISVFFYLGGKAVPRGEAILKDGGALSIALL